MSFLRRLVGGTSQPGDREPLPKQQLRWWDLPPGGNFEIAGVAHYKHVLAELFPPALGDPDHVRVTATLRPEPGNPYDADAVAVEIADRTVGYIPAAFAPDWGDFVVRLAREGLAPRLTATVWIGEHAWFVRLLAKEDAAYLTPAERVRADADADAARAARVAAREAAVTARKRQLAESAVRVCRDCGNPIELTGQRGRPPVRCAACRGVQAATAAFTTPPPRSASRGQPDEPIPSVAVAVPRATPAGAGVWVPLRQPAAWAVVDTETTGLWPRFDRIVEIAIVRVGPSGDELDAWTTMVNPERDMGATEIHGIRASDVRGAPTFADVAPELLARLAGARIAAHNARFEMDFLAAGLQRAGLTWPRVEAFCTMVVPNRLGVLHARALNACCAEIGVPYERAHTALSDARAAEALLAYTLSHVRGDLALPEPAPIWPEPAWTSRPRLRTEPPPPRVDPALGQLADRVGVPEGSGISDDAALAYLSVLDRVVEDRVITEAEVAAFAGIAADWGIGADVARVLHRGYLRAMWGLALGDNVVTSNELHDLRLLSELLCVPLSEVEAETTSLAVPQRESLVGRSVCFTGASVVTIGGAKLSREDQEALAADAGLVVLPRVTKSLDLLVLADPDSRSGKAKLAEKFGTRRIAEAAFWRAAGVEID